MYKTMNMCYNELAKLLSTKMNPKPFTQVVVWPSFAVGKFVQQFNEFIKFIADGSMVQYITEIVSPFANGVDIPCTGGRNDLLFAIHEDDIIKFAVKRKANEKIIGMPEMYWLEDFYDEGRADSYPDAISKLRGW